MTLDETEKLKICEILEISSLVLEAKLIYYLAQITPVREVRIRAQLTRWYDDGVGSDFDVIEPNTKNFGFRGDPEAAKNDVRGILATLLFFEADELGTGALDSFTIERG